MRPDAYIALMIFVGLFIIFGLFVDRFDDKTQNGNLHDIH